MVPACPPGYTQPVTKPSAVEVARAKLKEMQVGEIRRMMQEYAQGKIDYAAVENFVQQFNNQWDGGISAKDTINRLKLTDPNLGLTLVAQETSYWCGPASAYMVLDYMGALTDPSDPNRSLSQTNLASDLGTTTNGTDFNNVPGVLNHWINLSWYTNTWGPSASNLLYYASVDYADGYPLMYDAHMDSTNGYLTGWSTDVWHYVAGDGYNNTDSTVHYYDPDSANTYAYGNHWVTASLMASVVSERGMTW